MPAGSSSHHAPSVPRLELPLPQRTTNQVDPQCMPQVDMAGEYSHSRKRRRTPDDEWNLSQRSDPQSHSTTSLSLPRFSTLLHNDPTISNASTSYSSNLPPPILSPVYSSQSEPRSELRSTESASSNHVFAMPSSRSRRCMLTRSLTRGWTLSDAWAHSDGNTSHSSSLWGEMSDTPLPPTPDILPMDSRSSIADSDRLRNRNVESTDGSVTSRRLSMGGLEDGSYHGESEGDDEDDDDDSDRMTSVTSLTSTSLTTRSVTSSMRANPSVASRPGSPDSTVSSITDSSHQNGNRTSLRSINSARNAVLRNPLNVRWFLSEGAMSTSSIPSSSVPASLSSTVPAALTSPSVSNMSTSSDGSLVRSEQRAARRTFGALSLGDDNTEERNSRHDSRGTSLRLPNSDTQGILRRRTGLSRPNILSEEAPVTGSSSSTTPSQARYRHLTNLLERLDRNTDRGIRGPSMSTASTSRDIEQSRQHEAASESGTEASASASASTTPYLRHLHRLPPSQSEPSNANVQHEFRRRVVDLLNDLRGDNASEGYSLLNENNDGDGEESLEDDLDIAELELMGLLHTAGNPRRTRGENLFTSRRRELESLADGRIGGLAHRRLHFLSSSARDLYGFPPAYYGGGSIMGNIANYMDEDDFDASYEGLLQLGERIGQVKSKGLSKEVFTRLTSIVYGDAKGCVDARCPICLLDYEDTERLRILYGCRHAYHSDCIDRWLDVSDRCPICRGAVVPEPDLREEYVSSRDIKGKSVNTA